MNGTHLQVLDLSYGAILLLTYQKKDRGSRITYLVHCLGETLDCDAGVVFGIPQELSFSGFSVSFYINEDKVMWYQLKLGK